MSLTLPEAAKLMTGEVIRPSVVETFARTADPLGVMPFLNVSGGAYVYSQEDTLPSVGFRAVNEAYAESSGVAERKTEQLVILGGDLDVDKFIVDTNGAAVRASHTLMKAKSLAHTWAHKFIKGDSSTTPKEFDGLQVRLAGSQLVSNSAGTGAALSLLKLDEAIDATDNPTHLYMSKAMRRLITAAGRGGGSGPAVGSVQMSVDAMGNQLTTYAGLPILIADDNADSQATLGFNEAAEGGGSTSTSIYVLSLGESMLTGIQTAPPEVRDLGEIDSQEVYRTRFSWYSSIALVHPRSATRLYGITNATVVE